MSHDIVVLREGTEGLPTTDYAECIRKRLPDHDVAVAATPHEELALLGNARVATGISITEEQVAAAENLDLFVVASSATGHLPMAALEEAGVAVVNAAGIHAPGIAEQVLGYLLTFARDLHLGFQRKERAEWRHYQPGELNGSTVTIVGLGAIGQTVVERLSGFDLHTIGVRYTPSKGGPTDEVIGFDDRAMHEAFARSDYLVLAAPLTDTTRGLVDAESIATLPPDAVVVNVARGGLVDTEALTHALQVGELRGAAMDVTAPEPLPPDHPLWGLGNVLITPHTGGHTPAHWPRLADILATNVERLDAGEPASSFENLVQGSGE